MKVRSEIPESYVRFGVAKGRRRAAIATAVGLTIAAAVLAIKLGRYLLP